MKSLNKSLIYIVIILALLVASGSFYVLRADKQVVVVRLGKVVASNTEPGLYFKLPFLDRTVTYTKKLIEYDADPVAVVTSDKKNLVFDTIALFRISDPETLYRRVRTVASVQQRLDDSIYSAVRIVAGRLTLDELVKSGREKAIEQSGNIARTQSRQYGVEIISVAFKRVFLPAENEQAVYRSMQAERNRVAAQLRAQGQAEAMRRRSIADRKNVEMIAEAKKTAEETKGEGDRIAQEIIANSTSEAKDLYIFLKTMEFYSNVLADTPVMLKPGDGVLKYLKGISSYNESGVLPGNPYSQNKLK